MQRSCDFVWVNVAADFQLSATAFLILFPKHKKGAIGIKGVREAEGLGLTPLELDIFQELY